MSSDIIKYGSVSGEISETLFGRSDLEQYDLAWAKAQNWFVNYEGGLSTRPGMEFCDYVLHDDKDTKFMPFQFAPDTANVYVVLFGHNYVRFIQDGGYVLEADKTITSIAKSSDVLTVTATAHGFSNGDWVKITDVVDMPELNGRTFEVSSVATDTFVIKAVPDLSDPYTTQSAGTGGVANRIYTLVSPYPASDLRDLRGKQRRDLIRLTHGDYAIRSLKRNGHTDWAFVLEPIGTSINAPSGVTATPSTAGDAGALFAVTCVDANGRESVMSRPFILNNSVNWSVTAGSVEVQWDINTQAVSYNVYRSLIHRNGDDLTIGIELGFIGKTAGTSFTDNNIIPDFTKSPPIRYNPFAPGSIKNITMLTPGDNYDKTDGMGITSGSGSGFSGYPVVAHEKVTGVLIRLPGSGYTTPLTVNFSTGSGGSGATATAELSPATGTYPTISCVFQQRQLYAASFAEPLTIWGSKPNNFTDFDYSIITQDSDSYEYELDSEQIAPIRHMLPMRGGLVLMSQVGVWQLTGTGNIGTVTAKNALAEPQNYTGVSEVEPIRVNTDLLYVEGKGYTVRLLSYNDYARVYNGEDRSLLSNHLFGVDKQITQWTFAENPFKIIWAARSDGKFLAFTLVKDEKIFGWTPHSTRGRVLDVANALEEGLDRTYFMTQRVLKGRLTKIIERLDHRQFTTVEDAFCVDCGLRLGHNYPNQVLTIATHNPETKVCTLTVSSPLWSADDVGKTIRAGGAKLRITMFVTSTQVSCTILRPFTDLIPEDPEMAVWPQAAGTWTFDTPVNHVSGLWHLEGETVAVLADGNVIEDLVVDNGGINLPFFATQVYVGLPYTCIAKTLPPVVGDVVIESRRKRTVEIGVRVYDTRGLRNGERLDKLYEMKERKNEIMGEPTELQSGMKLQLIEPRWDVEGSTYFVQRYPLPATILALVRDIEVGDDKD